jgi:hypothetical protein
LAWGRDPDERAVCLGPPTRLATARPAVAAPMATHPWLHSGTGRRVPPDRPGVQVPADGGGPARTLPTGGGPLRGGHSGRSATAFSFPSAARMGTRGRLGGSTSATVAGLRSSASPCERLGGHRGDHDDEPARALRKGARGRWAPGRWAHGRWAHGRWDLARWNRWPTTTLAGSFPWAGAPARAGPARAEPLTGSAPPGSASPGAIARSRAALPGAGARAGTRADAYPVTPAAHPPPASRTAW